MRSWSRRSPTRRGRRCSSRRAPSSSTSGRCLSHAAIVSRELGVPCAVSATGATARDPGRRPDRGRRHHGHRHGAEV
ncbi:PEP-utilizing enzyme [Pseudonocardia abyssalis]|uniref:PEP-utilizing enzyme n=1 Tax=Pseudonocardia abyssalis TaxID=2792008 RepID=UPI001CF68235|nr:PEP-utilizing enzyme [Pseudonocardia abyssalis]